MSKQKKTRIIMLLLKVKVKTINNISFVKAIIVSKYIYITHTDF